MTGVGARVRVRRKALGWTLRELASRAGLSFSFLCDFEHDRRGISADNLLALAAALGTTMTALVEGDDAPVLESTLVLPADLARWAQAARVPFAHVLALHSVWQVLERYDAAKAADWPRLYEAIREWLGW